VNAELAETGPDLRSPVEFARFYRLHLPTVYGYLHRLCAGDQATAEDLTQETWFALARELGRGNTACADIRWLLTVARSRFLDHARREHRRELKLTLLRGAPDRTEAPDADTVLASLDRLAPLHRLVLMLRYVEELTVPAVAKAISRNVTATNSLLARARAELRAQQPEETA